MEKTPGYDGHSGNNSNGFVEGVRLHTLENLRGVVKAMADA